MVVGGGEGSEGKWGRRAVKTAPLAGIWVSAGEEQHVCYIFRQLDELGEDVAPFHLVDV